MRTLESEGYHTPTPIQAQAIPHILEGRDLLGCAETGTGKTAAFALPILHRLQTTKPDMGRRGPVSARVLVLSPTRELATQIAESFATYGKHLAISGTVIYGGVGQNKQVRDLQRGVDVIIATPGRLIDLLEQGHVDLSKIQAFVLDEADRMLDMGFINPIRRIENELPKDRQTLLFSATMPKEIIKLAESLLKDPVRVSVATTNRTKLKIEQSVYMVQHGTKQALLETLLGDEAIERAVVFTRTKYGADKVSRRLQKAGLSADAIHGNKNQNQRQRALDGFKSGRSRVLVATDVAARGLDVDGVTHVFNFDMPVEPEAYVHRIGRTGRAGASGIAISFCDRNEREHLRAIERLTGSAVPSVSELPEGVAQLAATHAARIAEDRRADAGAREEFCGNSNSHSNSNNRGPSRGPRPARASDNGRPGAHGRDRRAASGRPAPGRATGHPLEERSEPRGESRGAGSTAMVGIGSRGRGRSRPGPRR
ncbi:MAG TPA: DEAD/DEAH box helicase [Polyangiaceae bacterium]